MTGQVVGGLQRAHEVPAADEMGLHGRHDAESRRQAGAHHLGVVLRDRHVRAAADHYHGDGHHVASQRGRPSVWVGRLEVRRGYSPVLQARWPVAPLVLMTEDWACDDLRPPESAESCDAMSTHRESE